MNAKFQCLIMVMLLAAVYTQAVARKPATKVKAKVAVKKPVVKAKISVKPKVGGKVKINVKKPKVHVKVPATKSKVKIHIGTKAKIGAKINVKVAPKLNLTGSCPAAKAFKTLEVLPKPIAYKTQQMCKGLKSGCCSEKSLTAFKSAWPMWVKSKSAFFWTLSKWPQGLATILRNQRKTLKCKLPGMPKLNLPKVKVTAKVAKKASRVLQMAVKANIKVPKVKLNLKAGMKAGAAAFKKGVSNAKKVGLKVKAGMKKAGAAAKKFGLKVKAGMKKTGAAWKAGMKKAGAAATKFGLKVKAGMKTAGAKLKIRIRKIAAGLPKFSIGANGWSLGLGQKLASLDTSFTAYVGAKQAPAWSGKVTAACANSIMMKKWVAKLILATPADDVKFSKWFWKGALELNSAIGNGKASKFAKFIGKKILGLSAIVKKTGAKLSIKMKKAGAKLRVNLKKGMKAGVKLAKGVAAKAKLGFKAGVKVAKKVAAKAKLGVKAGLKAAGKVKLSVKAKANRRLQTPTTTPTMNVSDTGVNLADAKFAANVKQPVDLAGDGQSAPAKSWMMFTGLMMLVAVLLN